MAASAGNHAVAPATQTLATATGHREHATPRAIDRRLKVKAKAKPMPMHDQPASVDPARKARVAIDRMTREGRKVRAATDHRVRGVRRVKVAIARKARAGRRGTVARPAGARQGVVATVPAAIAEPRDGSVGAAGFA
jgi:hypothetical protein